MYLLVNTVPFACDNRSRLIGKGYKSSKNQFDSLGTGSMNVLDNRKHVIL